MDEREKEWQQKIRGAARYLLRCYPLVEDSEDGFVKASETVLNNYGLTRSDFTVVWNEVVAIREEIDNS